MDAVIASMANGKVTADKLAIIDDAIGNMTAIIDEGNATSIRNFIGMVRSQAQKHKDDQLEALRQAHRDEEARLAAELAIV